MPFKRNVSNNLGKFGLVKKRQGQEPSQANMRTVRYKKVRTRSESAPLLSNVEIPATSSTGNTASSDASDGINKCPAAAKVPCTRWGWIASPSQCSQSARLLHQDDCDGEGYLMPMTYDPNRLPDYVAQQQHFESAPFPPLTYSSASTHINPFVDPTEDTSPPPLASPSFHSLRSSDPSPAPNVASNDAELHGFTTEQLKITYCGANPWKSAAKEAKLLMLGCKWHLLYVSPATVPDMHTLSTKIYDVLGPWLQLIPGFKDNDFGVDVIAVWDCSKRKYTTLTDGNLAQVLTLLECESFYSYLQVVPAGLVKVKTGVPPLPLQIDGMAFTGECETVETMKPSEGGGVGSSPKADFEWEAKVPLNAMLESAWQAYAHESQESSEDSCNE